MIPAVAELAAAPFSWPPLSQRSTRCPMVSRLSKCAFILRTAAGVTASSSSRICAALLFVLDLSFF